MGTYSVSAATAIAAQNDFATWASMVNAYSADARVVWDWPNPYGNSFWNSEHVCNKPHTQCKDNLVWGSGMNDGSEEGGMLGFFVDGHADEGGNLIAFVNPDGSIFSIRRDCGNVLGGISPLSAQWNITGRTGVSTTSYYDAGTHVSVSPSTPGPYPASSPLTVTPGQTTYWWSDIYNYGPFSTTGFQYGVRYTLNGQPAGGCSWPSVPDPPGPTWSGSCPPWNSNVIDPSIGIQNGGFNNGGQGWTLGAGTQWAGYTAASGLNQPFEGTSFLATNAPVSGGSVYQDIAVPVAAGQQYCFSAEVATQTGSSPASGTFALWLVGNSGNEAAAAYPSGLPINSWTKIGSCITATGPHDYMRIQYYPNPLPAGGTTVIDDVKVGPGVGGNMVPGQGIIAPAVTLMRMISTR